MKKAIKIYESIVHPLLFTSIIVNGKKIKLEFSGHQRAPKFVMGRVVIADLDTQTAIEKDPRYGVQFKLKRTTWVEAKPSKLDIENREALVGAQLFNKEEVNASPGQSQSGEPEAPKPEPPEVTDIVGVTNLASAKARLAEAAEVPLSEIPSTKAEVIDWANTHKFNLVGYVV